MQKIMSHSLHPCRQRSPMWIYEKNYSFLIKLFRLSAASPAAKPASRLRWRTASGKISIESLEQGPYTQLLDIRYSFAEQIPHLDSLHFKVRVYHDAELAEVVACQGMARLLSRYQYPNPEMLQRDEKRQANRLLHDWLTSLLQADSLPERDESLSPA